MATHRVSCSVFADPTFPLSIDWYIYDQHEEGAAIQRDDEPHAHDYTELLFIREGSGVHQVGKSRYPVSAGDVFVIQGDCEHALLDSKHLVIVDIAFLPKMLSHCESQLLAMPGYHALFMLEPALQQQQQFRSHLHLDQQGERHLNYLLNLMIDERWTCDPAYRAMLSAYFTSVVIYLSRQYTATTPSSHTLIHIGEVISYLETNYREMITLDALAEIAKMSVATLERRFRQGTGVTPIDYQLRLRIRHSLDLLQDGNLSITDIAQQVGFTDSNYFSRQFKRVKGLSPQAYRRQQREAHGDMARKGEGHYGECRHAPVAANLLNAWTHEH